MDYHPLDESHDQNIGFGDEDTVLHAQGAKLEFDLSMSNANNERSQIMSRSSNVRYNRDLEDNQSER